MNQLPMPPEWIPSEVIPPQRLIVGKRSTYERRRRRGDDPMPYPYERDNAPPLRKQKARHRLALRGADIHRRPRPDRIRDSLDEATEAGSKSPARTLGAAPQGLAPTQALERTQAPRT